MILMRNKHVTLPEWLTGSPAIHSCQRLGFARECSNRSGDEFFFEVSRTLFGNRLYLRGPDTAIDTKATRLPRENLTSTTRPSANSATISSAPHFYNSISSSLSLSYLLSVFSRSKSHALHPLCLSVIQSCSHHL
jgi:hypothetical protein